MGPISALVTVFRNLLNFDGRSGRAEYWWYWLFFVTGIAVLLQIDAKVYRFPDGTLPVAVMILSYPLLPLTIRRLHDSGKSAWWALIWFIPLGPLVLLILCLLPGDPGPNDHADEPLPPGGYD